MDNHHKEPSLNAAEPAAFVPPRHWIGPEELDANYWNDPKTREKRAQEFYEKPVEWIDQVDKVDKTGLARRDFLTLMGASMAMASFACARRPVHRIIPYVVKPEEITPGIPNWYASTCQECSAGCGVLVKNREGRPIKLEGNPEHPLNQGKLCGRGQASLLNLYDTDRLKNPVARSRGLEGRREISWEVADSEISSKLKSIVSGSGKIRILTGEVQGDSSRRLIREFLAPFQKGEHVEFEPLSLEEVPLGQELAYGKAIIPHFRFDQADFVLSLGADFLGSWISPVEYARDWIKKRKLSEQNPSQAHFSKLISFEPTLTLTGSNSDERYAIRPGDELKVALSLAHELLVNQKRSQFASDSRILSILRDYSPNSVAAEMGLPEGSSLLKRIADELWKNRGKGLVIAGGVPSKTPNAVSLQIGVSFLNSILGNEGITVDGTLNFGSSRSSFAAVSKLIQEMKAGQVDALIIHQSNPLYSWPRSVLGIEEAFKRVPLIVVISDREDETALSADYVLPDHHYLENWGDSNPRAGILSLQQPAIAPIHASRSFQDILLEWGKGGKLKSSGLISQAKDWHDFLQSHWKETHYRESESFNSFELFWEGALRVGALDRRAAKGSKPVSRSFRVDSLARLPKFSPMEKKGIQLVLYSKVSMHDGRSANNAWLQEMPDPISSIAWDNYLNIGPSLAKKIGLQNDDVVEVKAGDFTVELPVHIQPGLHSQVVSIAVGYGRRAVGKVGNEAGVDVFPLVGVLENQLVFSGQSVALRKTGKFYKLAATQWHTTTEDRPIINDITLNQFRKNPAAAQHTDPHLRLETVPTLWPVHEYKGYRWGMAIDLTSCIGCGSCMIACQAENNVPVVGRNQVRVSRQMHWIRIDRYYSGSPENPDVLFQPMLCQHCENAPCETVCPVLATLHDDEGVNIQIYNRCVGTRYCQNNCPYKVRRFNFFDHWKSYEGTLNLAWNPDVTVRTRGIMEKCTFCTQRIRDAKDKAKDAGERVRDGDFQVACQQTCPTDAIVFGDINDPESRVSKMKNSPQAFRVLEVLNTKPSVSYMTKVRHKEESAHSGHGAEHV